MTLILPKNMLIETDYGDFKTISDYFDLKYCVAYDNRVFKYCNLHYSDYKQNTHFSIINTMKYFAFNTKYRLQVSTLLINTDLINHYTMQHDDPENLLYFNLSNLYELKGEIPCRL